MIVFGIESGDDAILDKMNKGYHASDIVEQLSKMDEAGMHYSVIFLYGLGGHEYGMGHAVKTAEVLNHLSPVRVLASGLSIFPDTPLMEEVRRGEFVEATETEKIQELYTFVKTLDIHTLLDATNVSNMMPVYGHLPEDKEKILVVSRFFRKFISSASKYRHQMYGFSSSAGCSISILNRCSMSI